MILTPLQKLPNNVGNLDKIIVATGFECLPKKQTIAQSGHTGTGPHVEPSQTLIHFQQAELPHHNDRSCLSNLHRMCYSHTNSHVFIDNPYYRFMAGEWRGINIGTQQ